MRSISVCGILFAFLGMAFVQPALGKEQERLMSPYVLDGHYFEAKFDFTHAIAAYKMATQDDQQDRYAWVCLARVYRAQDALWKTWEQSFKSSQKRLAYEQSFVEQKDILHRSRCFEASPYGIYLEALRSAPSSRYDVDFYTNAHSYYASIVPSYFRLLISARGYFVINGAMDFIHARPYENKCIRLESAWCRVDNRPDSAEAWLDLATIAPADPANAAYHVVLLSNPSATQRERALLGISQLCTPLLNDRTIIAPVKRSE